MKQKIVKYLSDWSWCERRCVVDGKLLSGKDVPRGVNEHVLVLVKKLAAVWRTRVVDQSNLLWIGWTKRRGEIENNWTMYVCLTVALCDCVHGKEQHQLGQGETFFKEVLFSRPSEQIWLATHHWLSGSQRCSRALRLGWWGIPGPLDKICS